MGNFITDDDYQPYGSDRDLPTVTPPEFGDYNNPELGNGADGYGNIKKPNVFSRLFRAFSRAGAGSGIGNGPGVRGGITLEKVLLVVYVIAVIAIILNIKTVLDFLFYLSLPVLKYVLLLLLILLAGFIIYRYVLHMR